MFRVRDIDQWSVLQLDPSAPSDGPPWEYKGIDTGTFKKPKGAAIYAEREIGPPVRAEIDIDNISDPGRVDDPALDDLKAADVVPGLGRIADTIVGKCPNATPVLTRGPFECKHFADQFPVIPEAVNTRHALCK